MKYFLAALKKYAVFSGRARRKEYWYFALFTSIISLILLAIDSMLGTYNSEAHVGIIQSIFTLGLFLPSLAVTVRRLHDIDKSAWWLLLYLIPIIGPIVIFVFMVFDSKPQDNKYGPNPKMISNGSY